MDALLVNTNKAIGPKAVTDFLSNLDRTTLDVVATICDLIADELKFAPKSGDIHRVKIPSMEEALGYGFGYLYTYKLCQKMASDIGFISNKIDGYFDEPFHEHYLLLDIYKDSFYLFHGKVKDFINTKNKLEESKFDSVKGVLTWNSKELKITKYTKLFYFCEKLYEYALGHELSWDEVYEKIAGAEFTGLENDKEATEKMKRTVYDLALDLNERSEKFFGKSLVIGEKNIYRRAF